MKNRAAIYLMICILASSGTALAKKWDNKVEVTWLGHAAFILQQKDGPMIIIDPFITENPKTPAPMKDLTMYKPDAVLVTHSHADHLGDTLKIAQASGAPVIGSHDLITGLAIPKEQQQGGNVGGSFKVKNATVHLVPAIHGTKDGAVGFVIEFENGPTIYHTGDTWIFSDMKWIEKFHKPDILLFNMGGGPFTMNPKVAQTAIKTYFKSAKKIVPMHWGTYEEILATQLDIENAFKKDKKNKRKLEIMKPGFESKKW